MANFRTRCHPTDLLDERPTKRAPRRARSLPRPKPQGRTPRAESSRRGPSRRKKRASPETVIQARNKVRELQVKGRSPVLGGRQATSLAPTINRTFNLQAQLKPFNILRINIPKDSQPLLCKLLLLPGSNKRVLAPKEKGLPTLIVDLLPNRRLEQSGKQRIADSQRS